MKSFTRRVQAEKKKIMMEELPKQSSTAQRRKEKFKAIKQKRKAKKNGELVGEDDEDEESMDFGSREDGFIRPSDRNDAKTDFSNSEIIRFGETVHAPPNLKSFAQQLTKKKDKQNKPRIMPDSSLHSSYDDVADQENQEVEEEELPKKKRKKSPVDWDKFTSDEQSSDNQFSSFLSSTSSSSDGFSQFSTNPLAAINEKKKKQQSSSMYSQAELEKTRKEIQLKYRQLRDSKRKNSSSSF
jgi:hypothetical protein